MPLGCLSQFSAQDWESVVDVNHPELFNVETLNARFAKCITMVEEQIAEIMGLHGVEKERFCVRASGTQVVMKNTLSKVSSGGRKLSAVTIAWKNIFLWLTNLAVACSPRAKACHLLAAERVLRHSCWDHLGSSRHAQAVKSWCSGITDWHLRDRESLNWLRATAGLVASKTASYDKRQAEVAWSNWVLEGPARSLGRHHRMTKVAGGWIPSKVAPTAVDETERSSGVDMHDGAILTGPEEISEDEVRWADTAPLTTQQEVDEAGLAWGKEWKAAREHAPFVWPAHIRVDNCLPTVTVHLARDAANTFACNVGLGWDKLHPRAVSRCSDEALLAIIRILILAEMLGAWPACVGITLVCSIPKPDGGRRPIGLLPTLIRWWMRIRLDVVRA